MDLRSIRRPINLILDWDGTLTRKDTLHLVGQIGYQHKERLHIQAKSSDSKPIPPWTYFGTTYMDDYSTHQKHYPEKPETRRTITQERAWLASLARVENISVHRVEESGLFRGVAASDVDRTALHSASSQAEPDSRLQLRPGWERLFNQALAAETGSSPPNQVSILSVNWSERFIRQSLLQASESGANSPESTSLTSYVEIMPIRANEIAGLDAPEGSDGSLTKNGSTGIRTSSDKLARLPLHCRDRLDNSQPNSQDADSDNGTVIYVGDSATDFDALLAADVGICVRDEPMGSGQKELAETLQRVGVSVVHVSEKPAPGGRVVFWASDLGEIADALPSVAI